MTLGVPNQCPKSVSCAYTVELCLVSITPDVSDVQVFLHAIRIVFCIDEFLQSANFISTT